MPNFEQITRYEQVGRANNGLFPIAYDVDILSIINVYDVIYDQTKNWEHLIASFEQRKITYSFYGKRNTENVVTYNETSSHWKSPGV